MARTLWWRFESIFAHLHLRRQGWERHWSLCNRDCSWWLVSIYHAWPLWPSSHLAVWLWRGLSFLTFCGIFRCHQTRVQLVENIHLYCWFVKWVEDVLSKVARNIWERISEHMGISASTGKPLSKPSFSNILSYHQSSGHPIDPDDFSILASCSSTFELLLRVVYLSLNFNHHLMPIFDLYFWSCINSLLLSVCVYLYMCNVI